MYKFIVTDYDSIIIIVADTLEQAEEQADQLLAGQIEVISFI
jgi:hypothetical protein